MLTLKAPAKINLMLEVLGRRADGYHDIVSLMQTVDICDTVTLEPADEISLSCSVPELENESNLALRAALSLREAAGVSCGARISLAKNIPLSSGLGGGSSDAAAVLKGLNRMWNLGLSVDDLTPIAASLGSDVPFFLHGGTALVTGRGERVRPTWPANLGWMVILSPEIDMPNKTAAMYGRLTPSEYTSGALTRKLEGRIRGKSDIPPQLLFNVFDNVAFDAFPALCEYRDRMHSLGAREIHLAGSGPSMFALVSRREVGTAIQLLLTSINGWTAFLTQPYRAEVVA